MSGVFALGLFIIALQLTFSKRRKRQMDELHRDNVIKAEKITKLNQKINDLIALLDRYERR
jgi:hypothetical protein